MGRKWQPRHRKCHPGNNVQVKAGMMLMLLDNVGGVEAEEEEEGVIEVDQVVEVMIEAMVEVKVASTFLEDKKEFTVEVVMEVMVEVMIEVMAEVMEEVEETRISIEVFRALVGKEIDKFPFFFQL